MNTAMAAPNDWPIFQHDLNDDGSSSYVPTMSEFQMLISSVATTAVTTAVTPVPHTGSTSSSVSGSGLNPEGRVSKPARRRPRASRRTPTTLFNTDTTNFRAMVQQFTGGQTAAAVVARQANLNPGAAVMLPVSGGGSGYQLQCPPPAQSQQYAFSVSGGLMGNSGDVDIGQRVGVGGGAAARSRADVEGFMGERVLLPNSRTSSRSGGGNENRSNVFMY